jgi:two-component system, NtrC family, nitrogen regulation response regulator GlnG
MEHGDILVVDDDTATRDLLAELLTDAGYRVRLAVNGADGLRQMRARLPALLLTDLLMPVMTGVELIRAARAAYPTLKIIVMTASPTRAARLAEYYAVLCVFKPFDVDDVLTCIALHAMSGRDAVPA